MNVKVVREVPVTPPVKEVTLTFTPKEFKEFAEFVGKIGGGGSIRFYFADSEKNFDCAQRDRIRAIIDEIYRHSR